MSAIPATLPNSEQPEYRPQVTGINRRNEGFAKRILKSPFVLALVGAALVTGLTALTITAFAVSAPLGFSIPLAIVTGTAAVALAILIHRHKDVIWFDLSLLFVKLGCVGSRLVHDKVSKKVKREEWFNVIPTSHEGPNQLVLGAIPLVNKRHHKKIGQLPGTSQPAVLSVTESFESERVGLLGDPVRHRDWEALGYQHRRFAVCDLRPLTVEEFNEGINFIRQNIEAGSSVYVHCKAGRGRSLLMVAGYLMRCERELVERQPGKDLVRKVINLVKTTRPQICINKSQRRSLYAFAATLPQ